MSHAVVEYLNRPPGVLALRHEPPPLVRVLQPVVLVPPFGWEEVASYRERRWLAGRLAAAGHPTLRLDLPGTGDSRGSATDPGRFDAWVQAVVTATLRMAGEHGPPALLALGLGGLPAAAALSRDLPVRELVLWAVPARGRTAVRRLRTLSRMQSNQLAPAPGETLPLPADWLEAGGYVLDAELLERLAQQDVAAADVGGLQRALVLARDAEDADEALIAAWKTAGLDVTAEPAEGYEAMMEHPQRPHPPVAVAERLLTWLGEREPPPHPAPVPAAPWDRAIDDGVLREEPFVLPRPDGELLGILTRPSGVAGDQCAVLLNAGAQRRTGPNRMWVEAARRWAKDGIPTLRLDLSAIGDSDGDATMLVEDRSLHRPAALADVQAALDALQSRGVGDRFVVAGLCSGATLSFQAALADPRVEAIGMLNPRALVWRDDLSERRVARKFQRARSPRGWMELLRGEISPRAIAGSVRAYGVVLAGRLARWRARRAGEPEPQSVLAGLAELNARGTHVVMGFSGREPLVGDLAADGVLAALPGLSRVELTQLPGDDHELRPIAAQRAGHALLDRAVQEAE